MTSGVRAVAGTRALGSLVLTILVLSASCSSDGSGSNNASRNSSNFNTRSIGTFGSEIPTMPAARVLTRGSIEAGAWHRTYEIQVPATEVIAFYQRELPSAGWTETKVATTTPDGNATQWRRSGLRLDVTVAPSGAGSDAPTESGSPDISTVNLSLSRSGE
jgi:hypothetical protein